MIRADGSGTFTRSGGGGLFCNKCVVAGSGTTGCYRCSHWGLTGEFGHGPGCCNAIPVLYICMLVGMLYSLAITFWHIAGGCEFCLSYTSILCQSHRPHGPLHFPCQIGRLAASICGQSRVAIVIFWLCMLLSSVRVWDTLVCISCKMVSAGFASEREAVPVSFVGDEMQHLFANLDASVVMPITVEVFICKFS